MSLHVRGPLLALLAAVGLLATTVLLVVGQGPAAVAAVSPGTTVRASVLNNGSQAPGGGAQSAISANGRYVAFVGLELDPLDRNSRHRDVYVRDLVAGTTTLISAGTDLEGAIQPSTGDNDEPSISADGRYIAFTTEANNITAGVGDGRSAIVVCDRDPSNTGKFQSPCAFTTVSVLPAGTTPHGDGGVAAHAPRLSGDAGRLAWIDGFGCYTQAVQQETLVTTTLHKTPTGALIAPAASDSVNQTLPLPSSRTEDFCDPALSADGNQLVASVRYMSTQTDGDFYAIVGIDLRSNKITRLDVDVNGDPLNSRAQYFEPTVGADGRHVAFTSVTDTADTALVHLVDRASGPGAVATTSVVSKDFAGKEHDGKYPALSADGHYLAFVTDSPEITESTGPQEQYNCFHPQPLELRAKSALAQSSSAQTPTYQPCQVVVVNLLTAQHPELASANLKSAPGDGDSLFPVLSGDGGSVAFDSAADDLIAADSNKSTDSFVRTFQPGLLADPVDFGTVTVGQTAERTATIHHTGFGPLGFDQVSVGGAGFSLGGQTCTKAPLNGADTCLATVRFSPTDTVAKTGTLTLRAKATGKTYTVDLRGIGAQAVQKPPQFAAGPDPLDFGQQLPLAKNVQKTVTVVNGGASPLVIGGVSITAGQQAGDFTVSSNGCTTVQPGQSCQVTVKYSPTGRAAPATTPDQRTAALKFDDDAAGSPHLVALSGSVTIPTVKVSPGVGAPGAVITVTGTGFAASSPIAVAYLNGFPETASAQSDVNGTFTTSLLVFPLSELGPRTVQASVNGAAPAVAGTADLLVAPGSLVAPGYEYRH
ncbi:choice-of-anchor D domain-containing protein [Kutzneria sp. CA-103260]|uniref:choice-of-anchor D domain-containing protein n=1 Tax=Kutzneria sp. CA-103260 TaxID=2802641 RepID=UPI001BA62935|nr:choice-of-anchor D domain-containing protein [Kutzneria sp. CA-103260]QUQ62602.1 Tol-Pal system protein TolB [Kutzneria sp. CA-103260]